MLAAKIWIAHQDQVKPQQPRREQQLMAELIRELIVEGHHDPADVETALDRWRERRSRGDRVGRTTLPYILEDVELAAARTARPRSPLRAALDLAAAFAREEAAARTAGSQ
jgi:hypothetical protein